MGTPECRDLLDDLTDFVAGEASAARCADLERHLAGCEQCRVVAETLRQTLKLCRDLPQPAYSAEARARLYKSLHLDAFIEPPTP